MKACSTCREVKPLSGFARYRKAKDGRQFSCRSCQKAYRAKWVVDTGYVPPKKPPVPVGEKLRRCRYYPVIRSFHSSCVRTESFNIFTDAAERARINSRRYRRENPEAVATSNRLWKLNNAQSVRESNKSWRERNRDKVRAADRAWAEKNREKKRASDRKFYRKNRAAKIAYVSDYYQSNKAIIREKDRTYPSRQPERLSDYYHNVLKKRSAYRQSVALRTILKNFMRQMDDSKKRGRTELILGYSAAKLASRIEFQFQPGMNWENHGEWHIDHRIPVSRFVEKGETRPHIVNALSNLQPLWAKDNLSKGNRRVG